MNTKEFASYIYAQPAEKIQELLDVTINLVPKWLDGELQSHRKLRPVAGIELSAKASAFTKLVTWMALVRGYCDIPESVAVMFSAYRTKSEVDKGVVTDWESPLGPLTTWLPDAISAITSANNQGRSNVTTLLQTNLEKKFILITSNDLIDLLTWVKNNRKKLVESAKIASKQAVSLKPAVLSSTKSTIKSIRKTLPILVYTTKPIPVTIIGSYNAAGG